MGKASDISPRKLAVVKCLIQEDHYTQHEIAKKAKISQAYVSRIKKSLDSKCEFENSRVGKCGRKSKFTAKTERKLIQIAKTNRRATSHELKISLQAYGVNVCDSYIHRKLISAGLSAHRPRKKAKITSAKKRLAWAKVVQEQFGNDRSKVCFSDESIFAISEESSQYVRRSTSEAFSPNCIAQTVKHPTEVMVWSVMSAQGTGRLHIVEGMMDQHQYKKVLEQRLIPQLKDWFPNEDFIFMHDGAPCHKASSVTTYLDGKNIKILPWPGNSPDMNPIENLWAIVKKKLKKCNITNKSGLIERLIQMWHHDNEIQINCKNSYKVCQDVLNP